MRATATLAVGGALLTAFAIEAARGAVGDEGALLRMGALPNGGTLDHQYWRLVTYSLLHLNYLHLGLNLALLDDGADPPTSHRSSRLAWPSPSRA